MQNQRPAGNERIAWGRLISQSVLLPTAIAYSPLRVNVVAIASIIGTVATQPLAEAFLSDITMPGEWCGSPSPAHEPSQREPEGEA
jgi:hypothetical protein